ncbi:MAG: hypothetical protein ACFE9L_05245 [Candidatus Hodarchaeota archaeon]
MGVFVVYDERLMDEVELHLKLITENNPGLSFTCSPPDPISLLPPSIYMDSVFIEVNFSPSGALSVGAMIINELVNNNPFNGEIIIIPHFSSEIVNREGVDRTIWDEPGFIAYMANANNSWNFIIDYDASPLPTKKTFDLDNALSKIRSEGSQTAKEAKANDIELEYGVRYVGKDGIGNVIYFPRHLILFHELAHVFYYFFIDPVLLNNPLTEELKRIMQKNAIDWENKYRLSLGLNLRLIDPTDPTSDVESSVCSLLRYIELGENCP